MNKKCIFVSSIKDNYASSSLNQNDADTWLILPVVICLSQRLSHACLSTSRLMVKPRMAHYNSHSFLDLTFLLG